MTVRCGNPKHDKTLTREHHHDTVAQVRLCYSLGDNILYSIEEQDYADWNASCEYDADAAYERHLENACSDEHRAAEAWEAQMGLFDYAG